MDDTAETWVLPVAMGVLLPRDKERLAGRRLVALSNEPTPGVRPICIIDSIRRLVDIAYRYPPLRVVGYAHSIFLLGPLQDMSRVIPAFKDTLQEAHLLFSTFKPELYGHTATKAGH